MAVDTQTLEFQYNEPRRPLEGSQNDVFYNSYPIAIGIGYNDEKLPRFLLVNLQNGAKINPYSKPQDIPQVVRDGIKKLMDDAFTHSLNQSAPWDQ